MDIKLRHVLYALKQTIWIPIGFGIMVIGLAVVRGDTTIEDMLWGFSPGLFLWIGYFAYWLWRTQKKRADNPTPGEWS